MASGLSAPVVVVCTLLAGVSIAHADRRPVAVIDLSNDPGGIAAKFAQDLNPILADHPDLRPIPDALIVTALFEAPEADDHDGFVKATANRENAENQLVRFELQVAQQSAGTGQDQLQAVMPTPQVLVLYRQLAFVRGQALLGIPRQTTEAPKQFALAHNLDPAFVPDAARYLPDVVQAFEDAKKKWQGKGTLNVAGTGLIWIDGKEQGTAPAELELDAGPHVVWLSGPERKTAARDVVVETGKKVKVEIPGVPADMKLKVQRARSAIRLADGVARGPLMQQFAKLVGVRDAVLLTSANGKIIWQTWRENDGTVPNPGFSSLHEYGKKDKTGKQDKPIDVLAPLEPPKPVVQPKQEDPKPLVDERRWYQRRPVQASIALGVVAAVIAGYYIYKAATDDTVTWSGDIGPAGRVRF